MLSQLHAWCVLAHTAIIAPQHPFCFCTLADWGNKESGNTYYFCFSETEKVKRGLVFIIRQDVRGSSGMWGAGRAVKENSSEN